MAFKATQLSTSFAFDKLQEQAAQTKQFLTAQRSLMTQTCPAHVPLAVIQHLGRVDAAMTVWASTPGLADYAKAQYDDPAYDVVSEFQAMKSAISDAKTSLMQMFPKDGSGFLLYQSLDAQGNLVTRTFTASQLASAVSLIDAVISAIE